MKSHSKLPLNYELAYSIDLEKDTKMMLLMNIFSVLLMLPFALGIYIYVQLVGEFDYTFDLTQMLLVFLSFFIIIFIHELIHGLFFKLGTKEKINYKFHIYAVSASVKGVYFYKKHYLLVGIAPFIIITPILLLAMFLFPTISFPIYITIALHTAGCIGDFYVFLKVLKYPNDALIEDTGVGMFIYKKVE